MHSSKLGESFKRDVQTYVACMYIAYERKLEMIQFRSSATTCEMQYVFLKVSRFAWIRVGDKEAAKLTRRCH